jgi:3-(3-hydroxy-phenyl)propionate hydroxylase
MTDVIVVGRGPAGMMLAGELALAGVEVEIVERRATPDLTGSRAGGFHARTIELLDQRGIADRFLAAGQTAQTARIATTVLDISDVPTRHPYGLGLWQNRIEPILADWIAELGVPVHFGDGVASFTQDATGVDVVFDSGARRRASYLVGADGGRSAIRRAAGIGFEGWDATRSTLIAEVDVAAEPPAGIHQDEYGVHGLTRLGDGASFRVVTTERRLAGARAEATLEDLSRSLRDAFGSDFGVHSPAWISRFTDATRQATTYRADRVLLVGDAAHIHYPAGGQGIGLGIQDAVNLGFKLAQVVRGRSPETLLDTYTAERHPADARALQLSMALTATQRSDPRTAALNGVLDDLLTVPAARAALGARVHGLDVAYDLGGAHPLVGRRVPDRDLDTPDGVTRVFELLHDARPLVIGVDGATDAAEWGDLVRVVHARGDEPWILPVLGEVPDPGTVFVRPDGYVAWVQTGAEEPLRSALERWVGRPAESGRMEA